MALAPVGVPQPCPHQCLIAIGYGLWARDVDMSMPGLWDAQILLVRNAGLSVVIFGSFCGRLPLV